MIRRIPTPAIATLALLVPALAPAPGSAQEAAPPPQPMYAPPPGADAPLEPERRSTGMMVTGIVFTSVGVANGLGSIPMFIADQDCGEVCGIYTLGGLILAGAGVTFVSIGIPLWAVGASKVDPRDRDEDDARLEIGPGRADVVIAF